MIGRRIKSMTAGKMRILVFSHAELFICNICHKKYIHSVRVDNLTREIMADKTIWNDMISEHYITCAMNQADNFDERFCKFLKSIGIDAIVKED